MDEARCCHRAVCPAGARCIASIRASEACGSASGRNLGGLEKRGPSNESWCEFSPCP